jgi:ribulose-phosphate 3-epimerase
MIIYPSVLETNIDVFNSQMQKLSPFFDMFQIDITDNLFVPNETVQIDDLTILIKDSALNSKRYEFHLMTQNYISQIEKLIELQGALNIERVLIPFLPFEQNNYVLPPAPFEYGIVVNPEDMIEGNYVVLHTFSYIQIMTVNPGFQGNEFLSQELEKIKVLREIGYPGKILLDGGINDESLKMILKQQYLPDIICPGSFLREDTEKHLQQLTDISSTQ